LKLARYHEPCTTVYHIGAGLHQAVSFKRNFVSDIDDRIRTPERLSGFIKQLVHDRSQNVQ